MSWFRKPKRIWIGSIEGVFVDSDLKAAGKSPHKFEFVFHFYVDTKNRRDFEVTGTRVGRDQYKYHPLYSSLVKPFMGHAPLDMLYGSLEKKNADFWEEQELRNQPKPNPEFKLLHFNGGKPDDGGREGNNPD